MIDFFHPADDSGCAFGAHLQSDADTLAAGAALAPTLTPGLVIYLIGDLGAGKTTLVRGVLRALGYDEKVKSPTYTLIEPYIVSRLHLYHFDFYRFTAPEEFLDAGLDEYYSGNGICMVEWPDKAAPYLATADVEVNLTVEGAGRLLELTAKTEAGRQCANSMRANLERHLNRPCPPG